jgi:hypothetical protein
MAYFVVEIPINEADWLLVKRATITLEAAQGRLRRGGIATRQVIAGVIAQDSRLICLVEAGNRDTVRRLVALALLPAGRIREISAIGLTGRGLRPRTRFWPSS